VRFERVLHGSCVFSLFLHLLYFFEASVCLSKTFLEGCPHICPGMGGESILRPYRGVSEHFDIFRLKNFPGEDF